MRLVIEQISGRWIPADTAAVAAALAEAGLTVDPGELTLLKRDDRFTCTMPGDHMVWFPQNEAGLARLTREARVLRLLRAH